MDTTQRTKEQREDFMNELTLEDYMLEKIDLILK